MIFYVRSKMLSPPPHPQKQIHNAGKMKDLRKKEGKQNKTKNMHKTPISELNISLCSLELNPSGFWLFWSSPSTSKAY